MAIEVEVERGARGGGVDGGGREGDADEARGAWATGEGPGVMIHGGRTNEAIPGCVLLLLLGTGGSTLRFCVPLWKGLIRRSALVCVWFCTEEESGRACGCREEARIKWREAVCKNCGSARKAAMALPAWSRVVIAD